MIGFSGDDMKQSDAAAAIIGDDTESSIVLTVHNPLTGFVFDVEVVRIFKSSMKEINQIFESLTLLKINSIRNEPYEKSTFPAGQVSSRQIADMVWQKMSSVILDMLVPSAEVSSPPNLMLVRSPGIAIAASFGSASRCRRASTLT